MSGAAGWAATPAPAVSSISVTSGPTAGHVRLTVHGSGFTGLTKVLFGGAHAGALHVASSHTITLTVPAHAAARLNVRVVTSHGTSAVTRHDVFTYVAPPKITSLSAKAVMVTGGTRIVVHGSSFVHVRRVLFGTTPGTKLHVTSAKTLAVTVPAHVAGVVDVRVVTSYGKSSTHTVDRFSFVGPVLTTVALPSAERGVAYAATLVASAGVAPYTWTASGLPAGMVLSASGKITGKTFVDAGQSQVTVTVTDHLGRHASSTFVLTVKEHAGQVLAWGDNVYGEIGNQTMTGPVTSPVPSYGMTDVVQVVGGSYATYALRADGTVYSWGSNTDGALGMGTSTGTVTKPEQIPGLSGIVALAAGEDTAYALKTDGTVVGWGYNVDGEVGDGTTVERDAPVAVVGLSGVTALSAGWINGYALRSDGSLWSWGSNTYGGLGVGSGVMLSASPAPVLGLSGVTAVSSKVYDSYALLSDGTVRAWGSNSAGEAGDTTTTQRPTPVPVLGLTGVREIAAGDYCGYAVLTDGTVRAWGQNDDGELGDSSTTTRLSPVTVTGVTNVSHLAAGAYNAYVQHPDGSVQVWGSGVFGGGGDGTTTDRLTAVTNPSLFGVTFLAPSHLAGFAVR